MLLSRVQSFKPTLHGSRPKRRPCPRRAGDAFELPGAEVFELEQIAEKSAGALGDDYHVRLGDPLQARCDVGRLANNAALLRVARSDQVPDDHQPSRNADTGLQRRARLKPGDRRDQL